MNLFSDSSCDFFFPRSRAIQETECFIIFPHDNIFYCRLDCIAKTLRWYSTFIIAMKIDFIDYWSKGRLLT